MIQIKGNIKLYSIILFLPAFILAGCQSNSKKKTTKTLIKELPKEIKTPKGMVWIPGGIFEQGAISKDSYALAHEKPSHKVALDGFFMDITEVTNAQFAQFVKETKYVTIAERQVDWEELKKQLPQGTQKPADSILQPGTMTFMKCHETPSNLEDYSQWWSWTIGANWKHPKGPETSIEGLENHPVVQIAYEDALAYCKWSGRRLPTESEWEYASRSNQDGYIFFWGNNKDELSKYGNTWEGEFPVSNTLIDGFERSAPVKSYQPNSLGLYDMAGNVWEWSSDWYNADYYKEYKEAGDILKNPIGAERPHNPRNPLALEKVIKGGSFLCNASYCASYRISSRMATTADSSLEHLGFRTVATIEMLKETKNKKDK
jgi:sulfatase modifying factor 1